MSFCVMMFMHIWYRRVILKDIGVDVGVGGKIGKQGALNRKGWEYAGKSKRAGFMWL